MKMKLIGKKLDTSPLYNKIVQGEANADTVEITLPKSYEGLDLSGFSFSLRTVSENDTVAEQVLYSSVDGDNVKLTWTITDDFTTVSGPTKIQLTGLSPDALTTVKFVGRDINVLPDVNGSVLPTTDVIAQALAQVQLEVQRAIDAADDAAGKSAYEVALDNGYSGTETEWLASLKGDTGDTGATGAQGVSPTATVTKSGAVATISITDANGTTTTTISDGDGGGSDNVWYPSFSQSDSGISMSWSKQATTNAPPTQTLQNGSDGASAYELAVEQGYSGTQAEWLASLKGADGESGADGQNGATVSVNNISHTDGNITLTLDNIPDGSSRILAASQRPIGEITMWVMQSTIAPQKWLFCHGQEVSRITYDDLFAVIGTAFGAGDGSTTFNVPDLRGRIPVGLNSLDTSFDALGKTGGEKTHTLTVSEMPSHTHAMGVSSNVRTAGYGSDIEFARAGYDTTSSAGGNGSHNNLQPYITVDFIIYAGE